MFECFREHNLKLKPTKCEFFKNETNYLAHHVSKEGVQPSKESLIAVAGFAQPQTYTEIQAFVGLVGITNDLLRGSHALLNLCMNMCQEKASARRMSV